MLAPNEVYSERARNLIRYKARQLSRQSGFCRSDREDIEQELWLHLSRESKNYDAARGSVEAFANTVTQSGAAMLARMRQRLKRAPAPGTRLVSLEATVVQADASPRGASISRRDMERRSGGNFRSDEDLYEVKASIESAIAGLSPELRDLAQRLMQERRSRVRRDLGWPRRKFVNSVAVIRKHFEGAGLTGI